MRNILIILFCSFVAAGCSDKNLNLPVYTYQTEDNFYKNTDQLRDALTGVYWDQRHVWSDLLEKYKTVMEIPTDNAIKGGYDDGDQANLLQLENFTHDANNSACAELYSVCMRIITSANILIKNSERTQGNAGLIKRYVNEAKFLRGWAFFHLAVYYGGVAKILEPLKDPKDYLNYPRLSQDENFEFILEDLKAATELPKKSEYPAEDMGRATSGAAWTLMAKIYLFQKDYENAKLALEAVIKSGEYSLHPNFGYNFYAEYDNGCESIYEVQYKSFGTTWDRSTGMCPIWFFSRNNEGGYGFCCPTKDLFDAFEPDDPRISYTFIFNGDRFVGDDYDQSNSSKTGYHDRKIFVSRSDPARKAAGTASETDLQKNYVYMRYSDVLLMYAEVLNELQIIGYDGKTANDYLNMIRLRARQTPPKDIKREKQAYIPNTNSGSVPDITVTSKDELREAILKERRLEFALEGWRRFDLVRTGTYGSVMREYASKYSSNKGMYFREDRDYLLPIHTGEIDKSHGVWKNNPNF